MAGGCCNNADEDSRGSDLLCVLTCGGAGRAFCPRPFSGLGVCSFTSNCRASSAFRMIDLTEPLGSLDLLDESWVWVSMKSLWLFSAIEVDVKKGLMC